MFWTIESYWPMTTWYKKCQMFYCCFSNSYVYYSCRYCMCKKCQIILRCFYNNFVYCPCQRSIFWQKDAPSLFETALFNEHYSYQRSISDKKMMNHYSKQLCYTIQAYVAFSGKKSPIIIGNSSVQWTLFISTKHFWQKNDESLFETALLHYSSIRSIFWQEKPNHYWKQLCSMNTIHADVAFLAFLAFHFSCLFDRGRRAGRQIRTF